MAVVVLALAGCGDGGGHAATSISIKGSDTIVQVATAWAEEYSASHPQIAITASGGGSGTGIAGLIDGTVGIATSSREIRPEEVAEVRRKRGLDVREHVIGYDALAVFVHPGNPLDSISMEELQQIWAEDGTITRWSDLTPALSGRLVLIGRQNSSGTYDYFREVVCGKTAAKVAREFRGGVSELNGSSEVVEKIAKAPLALGYTGMGYKNPHVKWLAVSRRKGEPGVLPSIASAHSGAYPIARRLYLYTAGEPPAALRAFLDWTLSAAGQEIVGREGFVPLKP